MDPTKIACKIYNSFNSKSPKYDRSVLPKYFSNANVNKLTLNIKTGDDRIVPIHCDIISYNKRRDLHFHLPNMSSEMLYFDEAVQISDPFNGIGNSIFGSIDEIAKASLKIANIDAIFKLTGSYSSLLKMRSNITYSYIGKKQPENYSKPVRVFKEDTKFVACVVEDKGWAVTNYLQFRLENARIYDMSSRKRNWGFPTPSTKYFLPITGEDGTGNIIPNWNFLVKSVLSRNLGGVNLFIANGDIENVENKQSFVLSEVLAGLKICGGGGNFIIKIYDTLTQFYAELIYIISQCFKNILFFKPVTCSPESSEKYLICMDRKPNEKVTEYTLILEEVFNKSLESYVSSFLKEKLPEDFKIWFKNENNLLIENEIESLEKIQKVMLGENIGEKYNLRKALKIWSLPGNVPRSM